MHIRTRNGDVIEVRSTTWGSAGVSAPTWGQLRGGMSYSGRHVTLESAVGLPAAMQCIRVASEMTARPPLFVWKGRGPTKELDFESWQAELLDRWHESTNPFNALYDIEAGIEAGGNSFAKKIKAKRTVRGRKPVLELEPIQPDYVRIVNRGGVKTFDVHDRERKKTVEGLTTDDIVHFRGPTINGSMSGYSPVTLHRHPLGNAQALEEFRGRYFDNDATPSGGLELPGNIDESKAQEILTIWELNHGGLENAGKPALLANGAKWVQFGMTLADAQFVEAQKLTNEAACAIWNMPVDLLLPQSLNNQQPTEEKLLRLQVVHIGPRWRRIEDTLRMDPDLFAGTGLSPAFFQDDLIKTTIGTQASADVKLKQAGIETANEIRARRGLPPHPDGDGLQVTPVGGAPNNSGDSAEDPTPVDE